MKFYRKDLSKRTDLFQESAIREMTRIGNKFAAINLSQGLPDYEVPAQILESAISAIREQNNQYTFPFGDINFRETITRKTKLYNFIESDPETNVTVTCGVSEAIMASVFALTEPGDEVILLEPWYENYLPACILAGVKPRFVKLVDPDYLLDVDQIEAAINSKTRLLFINTPHNPTGRVFSREELQSLANICMKHGIIVLSDEIYEYIIFDRHPHISIGSLPGMEDLSVTISGLGKTFAVTGWRVGWAIAASKLTRKIRKVHDYLTICAPAPFQSAGIKALELPSSYFINMCSTYQKRRDILVNGLQKAGFFINIPEGAYYLMANFRNIEWPVQKYSRSDWPIDRAFTEYLVQEIGIAVVPGSSFYSETSSKSQSVRFNFAQHEDVIQSAVNLIQRLSF